MSAALNNLNPSLITVSSFVGFVVLLVFLAAFSRQKTSKLTKGASGKDEWLYSNLLEKLYTAIFNNTDPIKTSKALGLEYDKYMINCNIIGKEPNFKKECMMRLIGVFTFFFGLLMAIILFNALPMIIGIAVFVLMVTRVTKSVEGAAKNKKSRLKQDLPRFVDLFLSALEVGLPVETAIIETAESIPCVISDELKNSIAEMKMGGKSWNQALEDIAHKYEIDIFSDFVLDIITAYKKGVSVTESVARKSYEIKQSALLAAKERTAKMSTEILVPVVVFKILPLLVLMMIPILMQITSTFG